MKFACLVCAILLTSGLLPAPAQTPAPSPARYTDAKLHFDFSYPAGLTRADSLGPEANAKARADLGSSGQATIDCLTTPMVATEGARTPGFGVLVLSRLDLDCRKQPAEPAFVAGMTQSVLVSALAKMGYNAEVGQSVEYRLSGKPADVVEGVIPAATSLSHAPIYGETVCALVAHDAVCWISFSGVSRQRARELLVGMIKFPGEAALPLVPASLLK